MIDSDFIHPNRINSHPLPSVISAWPEKNILYNRLFSIGDFIQLKFKCDAQLILHKLNKWESSWQRYNPRDILNNRWGLPYTSVDGNVIDPISLDSIRQYNKLYGTSYIEESFIHKTDVARDMIELDELSDLMGDMMYRSHFLRLSKGGFFPTHRDAIYNTSFRILIPFTFSYEVNYFIYEGKPVQLHNGSAYLIDTTKRHSLFSMSDHMTMMVFNVGLNDDIVNKIYKNLDGV